jgi:hypothetical protein
LLITSSYHQHFFQDSIWFTWCSIIKVNNLIEDLLTILCLYIQILLMMLNQSKPPEVTKFNRLNFLKQIILIENFSPNTFRMREKHANQSWLRQLQWTLSKNIATWDL